MGLSCLLSCLFGSLIGMFLVIWLHNSDQMRIPCLLSILLLLLVSVLRAQSSGDSDSFISTHKGVFSVSSGKIPLDLMISPTDWPGVRRAFADLQTDIGKVTSTVPTLIMSFLPSNQKSRLPYFEALDGRPGRSPSKNHRRHRRT